MERRRVSALSITINFPKHFVGLSFRRLNRDRPLCLRGIDERWRIGQAIACLIGNRAYIEAQRAGRVQSYLLATS